MVSNVIIAICCKMLQHYENCFQVMACRKCNLKYLNRELRGLLSVLWLECQNSSLKSRFNLKSRSNNKIKCNPTKLIFALNAILLSSKEKNTIQNVKLFSCNFMFPPKNLAMIFTNDLISFLSLFQIEQCVEMWKKSAVDFSKCEYRICS